MYVFFRPCNEKDAIMFLIVFACMVALFGLVKGVIQCGKN